MVKLLATAVLLIVTSLPTKAADVDYVHEIRPILQKHCYSCHGADTQKSGLRLDIKSEAFKGGDGWGPSLIAGKPEESPLIELVSSEDESYRMPPEGKGLTKAEIETLTRWVDEGAIWPDGVDLAKLEDRMDHWSFKPLTSPDVPAVENSEWTRNEIDRFILARLEQENLNPAPSADTTTWLRRVTLDLTGLLPTPQELSAFLEDVGKGEAAYEKVVNRLLASPRYGEHFAQHWLDVARYADTHGFEVNTERPNAWPYRDYVIEAFNNDTPYDQFIKEQLVGDAMGTDAATGFLVTASVLLPGQIGKDAPSIRLARQDALDEIVNNIGQTFLGLSIGCARCHDHKFDPISAKDYYSMQAFVAGVEYGDRKMQTPETEALQLQAELHRKRVAEIDQQLLAFVPLAHPRQEENNNSGTTSAELNVESFSPIEAKYIRFTIHDSNLHPKLGLIEPCIDEFEIWTDEESPQNIALASHGTKVTASGSRVSASHRLEHIHDGEYGNSKSWMSDTPGTGWVIFELPAATRISKIIWSRDRNGQFNDRLPTSYTLEAAKYEDDYTQLKYVPPRRSPVVTTLNTDRFEPVRAKRLRFTVLATNNLEPCLDELEVFNTDGQNIALASQGATVKTSGDLIVSNRHEPQFINDGKYGNSRSWLSNQAEQSWVELEFTQEQEIDRVVWGRDREGKLKDRLPIEYRIETNANEETWQLIADSSDRKPWSAKDEQKSGFSTVGLSNEEAKAANRLLNEQKSLNAKIKSAENGQLAFAGKFRKPDEIHLLRRGDPEQPAEKVTPAVLSSLDEFTLPESTPEQERRKQLAEWIADPNNPLTARVMANRIWQWHFGTGFVDTPNDFGRNGTQPTHPELLDWLAQELIRSDWSVKQMHRKIVLSATYRQSAQFNAEAASIDSESRLLWRWPSRRMSAESIRDCILAVSGQLNLKMGGRGYNLFKQRGGLSGYTPIESFDKDGLRRMIYAHKVRRERDAVFGAFDCPDGGQSQARRIESTTPIQALNLFNSRFIIDQAEEFAKHVQSEVGDDTNQQVQKVYLVALNRNASEEELKDVEPIVREYGLATLCRVLFNSNEFLFIP
ncbi:PSD1 and planctomycete cytochrome C domain-containing protein [Rubinisphaera sp.]|uniref:PSD1 and planctomycete cytochrome C domain-containing protein n=1 Tax=Rubinisphaera sp. TaxID=2024857 RepID=UPI000C0DB731|nr:PSD1 and planctomycete cytochrome C domain-containing protein [Rubinisphaera sp.]MBV09811.1 hypothetical protein [Rubinisphaera sp.]